MMKPSMEHFHSTKSIYSGKRFFRFVNVLHTKNSFNFMNCSLKGYYGNRNGSSMASQQQR